MSLNSHFPCALPVTDGYVLQQVGVPPSHPPPLLSTFSSKTPWEHGTGTDLLPQAQVLPSTQPHIHTSRYHTVCKTRWHQCRLFFPALLLADSFRRFWYGQSVSHYQSHWLSPQHPHPPNQAKHSGPIRWYWQPGGKPWRWDAGNVPKFLVFLLLPRMP